LPGRKLLAELLIGKGAVDLWCGVVENAHILSNGRGVTGKNLEKFDCTHCYHRVLIGKPMQLEKKTLPRAK
jgi:hypothetical protein